MLLEEEMKLVLGMILLLAVVAFVYMYYSNGGSHAAPRMSGESARLPCLANNHCPMGQACSGGFCSEGFMSPIASSTDMSSCSAKECKSGVNTTCSRKETPCPEGTFCQNDNCVNITAQDQGEAYKQIGMLLD
jgi:hypothetical protein